MIFSLKKTLTMLVAAGLVLSGTEGASSPVYARDPSTQKKTEAFTYLSLKENELRKQNQTTGWAYMISGTLVLGVSIPGYYLSNDTFARVIYSLGETLGVAAIGYGSYLAFVDTENARFVRVLDSVPSLQASEKEALSRAYLRESADRGKSVRKVRAISHGLTAALNFTNALTSSQSELKTALFFIGGVNLLAAASFTLGQSDEEKTAEKVMGKPRASLELGGPGIQLALRF